MGFISRADVSALLNPPNTPCVSIFQPTHRPAAHTEQDRIRFKNLLGQAEEGLLKTGMRRPAARELLQPAVELLNRVGFWQHQSDGLAVFLAPGMAVHYCLPLSLDELVSVGSHFHVKPLTPILTGDGHFYVLAISQNQVRLFEGTRDIVSEVDLRGVPQSLADALKYDQPEKQLQWHTRAPSLGGERAAMFHGHGVGDDDAKDRILRYFRAIDAGLQELLRDERAPLVLAGVDYYFPIYRKANNYAGLLESGVKGNPDEVRPEELHRQAWEIVRPHFEKAREDARSRFQALAGKGRTSTAIEEILPAARDGRVETLFVNHRLQVAGTFDAEKREVARSQKPKPGDLDLLELAVLHTLSNNGRVYAEDRSPLLDGSAAAALFRY